MLQEEGEYMGEAITLTGILQSLGLTILFVGLIGYERQKRHKIAGLTTHLMVALAAAGITLLQEVLVFDAIEFAKENPDIASTITFERQRIVAQVISGVGFLGTGAILKTQGSITGLTTASTLWASAIIGIIFGYGQIVLGISVSVLMLFVLTIIKAYIRNHQEYEQDHEL